MRYTTDLFCWILEPLFVSRFLSHAIQNRIAKYKSNNFHLFFTQDRSFFVFPSPSLFLTFPFFFPDILSSLSRWFSGIATRTFTGQNSCLSHVTRRRSWFSFSSLRKQLLHPVHAHTIIDYRNLADHIADHSTCPITRVIYYCPIRTYRLARNVGVGVVSRGRVFLSTIAND